MFFLFILLWAYAILIFKASNHRVRASNLERISIPFFTEFSNKTDLSECCLFEPNIPPQTYYGSYIAESNKRFKEYQRDNQN